MALLLNGIQRGGGRGHSEIEETEAGDRDMNQEAARVFRNSGRRTRPRQWQRKRNRQDTRDISMKSRSAWLVIGQNKETDQSKIPLSFFLVCFVWLLLLLLLAQADLESSWALGS